MPRYRALGPLYLRKLVMAGEEFESDLPPGRNWEPLDDEAKAAVEQYRAANGKVIAIAARLDPPARDTAAVQIPDIWRDWSGAKRRGLARRLGAQANVKVEDANSFIEAELERRGAKAA